MPLKDVPLDLPFGPPPVLPVVQKQLKEYILCPENLPIHDYRFMQQHWGRRSNPHSLYNIETAPLGTTLKVSRDLATGEIIDFVEVHVDESTGAMKALSEAREPLWAGQFVDTEDLYLQAFSQNLNLNLDKELSNIPPGFQKGIEFDADGFTPIGKDPDNGKESKQEQDSNVPESSTTVDSSQNIFVNLMEVVEQEQALLSDWMSSSKAKNTPVETTNEEELAQTDEPENDIIPKEVKMPVLKIRNTIPLKHNKLQWAEILDLSQPATDFHERVPNMAHKYEFELDVFQKQAVMKLEERCDVFVAAHTSAGKTVVAEYAIALSMKHMTKAIYTSPIKALSNQKYRDFKHTFGDVGLITGDWKINETASCLIMTTEILRSMLYCCSDVVPDLEYVIFDEVHYINDSDRGHVWEEVLIMLPPSVSIVMLSATVPNTLEFAQWVGRTRQKKVYVITTPKRPVPLEHYLYTGTGGSSKDDRFLIMDGQENFSVEGYRKAEDSRTAKPSTKPAPQGRGPPPKRSHWNYKQEKTMWIALIDHLRKREELPVVAFTLSRNRCDNNAEELRSLDLTVGTEKSKIDGFIRRCVQQLQPADKNLPQVLKMTDLLRRGIGVHHSGILPILKEIVEMLFQDGLVKMLFATETFAMGVNMPTRSVIFDTIRKFDGIDWRHLYPGEYIQMAGRAGRRGKDRVGNVIILCKAEIPKEIDLRNMMKGKPMPLLSKFRLTYKMMLNLLRRENLKVEEMMSRSFKETSLQETKDSILTELKNVETEIKTKGELSFASAHSKQLADFCRRSLDFLNEWSTIQREVVSTYSAKYLTPGRIILVTHQQHCNKIGVILFGEIVNKEHVFRVLLLCHANQEEVTLTGKEAEECDEMNKILSFAWPQKYFIPEGSGGHTLIQVRARDILEVSSVVINIKNVQYVKQDWEKRQQPRFKDAPVGQMCAQLVQDLSQLMHRITADKNAITWLDPVHDMKVNDIHLAPDIKRLEGIRLELSTDPCTNFANLEDELRDIFAILKLQQRKNNLKYSISYQGMTLYPDYLNRLNVLRRLRYIDDHDTVELKGKVACEMSSHELMITELVMEGVLTNLPTAEIAALLSCLVFQHKTDKEQKLTKSLEQGIEEIQRIHRGIENVERECKVGTEDPSCESENQLNFNLVQVVYEWAKAKPFAEIMELTDIQEGIIVRCIQQLHETLQDVKRAARIYGDPKLSNKMDEASNAIKRDIVFSVSLYTKMVFVRLSVPDGMDAALQGLTREVLRHQPADIYSFAAQYFENLIHARAGGHAEGVAPWQSTRTSKRLSRMESLSAATLEEGGVASQAYEQRLSTSTSVSRVTRRAGGDVGSSQEDSPRGDGVRPASGQKSSKKRRAKKDKARREEAAAQGTSSDSTESHRNDSNDCVSPKGELAKQVDSIAKGLAHETVLRTEEISRRATEQENSETVKSDFQQESILKVEASENDEKLTARQRRGTRKLRRQTKSVDSNSLSDKSESDGRFADSAGISVSSDAIVEKNETNVSESYSVEIEQQNEKHTSSATEMEVTEIRHLQDGKDDVGNQTAENQAFNDKLDDSASQEKDITDAAETNAAHNGAAHGTSEDLGESPGDLKSEELLVLSKDSVRKSSVHDIREETGKDGSHVTTEEKAEETQEEKHEASERTTLERKSNVQVAENGDVVEEEITITRTEQSSKTETTVSKSWTMETTIETLADGETRVIERMILHSPPPNESDKEDVDANAVVHVREDHHDQTHVSGTTTISTHEETDQKEKNEVDMSSVKLSSSEKIIIGQQKMTVEERSLETTTSAIEPVREFGLIDNEKAKKSIEQISVALEEAEKSLDIQHLNTTKPDKSQLSNEGLVEVEAQNEQTEIQIGDKSTLLDESGEKIVQVEFGLIDPEEAKKSLEQISGAMLRAEETLEFMKSDKELETVDSSSSKNKEVNENGQVLESKEFGLIDPEEAKKSLEQISVALSIAEDSISSLHRGVEGKHHIVDENAKDKITASNSPEPSDDQVTSTTEPRHSEVDEDGKEVISTSLTGQESKLYTSDEHKQHKSQEHVSELVSTTVQTTKFESVDIKPQKIPLPLQEADLDKGSDISKEESKEEALSEPKCLSSQPPDFPTDEDQATPRDEVESLRVYTPEDSSAAKTSSGSDENGDAINPLTVVISRTADVIELKDGEANIVSQMEKEGLVFKEGNSVDEPIEKIFTKGALRTLAEESGEQPPDPRISAKVVGLSVVAATTGFVATERGDGNAEPEVLALEEIENDGNKDIVEIVAVDFATSQFIQEESKHSSWLLVNPSFVTNDLPAAPVQASDSVNQIKEVDKERDIGESIAQDDSSAQQNKVPQKQLPVQNEPELQVKAEALEIQEKSVLEESAQNSHTSSSISEKIKEVTVSTRPEIDDDGKPIPVDENGKPIYTARKKRSLEEIKDISIVNDIIPDSKVGLSRKGSIVRSDATTEHWYGSLIPASGSALIKPALAMGRDPTVAALQPCNEPKFVAVDVRDKNNDDAVLEQTADSDVPDIKGGIDVMRKMSLVTSRIGQSILSLGSENYEEEKEEGNQEVNKNLHEHIRSTSQESFIISKDAVYIPLNPPGLKEPSLERIDSEVSLHDSINVKQFLTKSYESVPHEQSSRESISDVHDPPLSEVVDKVVGTTSTATYTVTEPKTNPEKPENELHDVMSCENHDDELLIVEYPIDPNGKVTKWDNVVVTSPAGIKDDQKENYVQPFESMPEVQSHVSMDDSLQEVPSLQDEAVGHIDSESDVLDSLPEEDADRKWTDNVAIVADKAKGSIMQIFSQGSEGRDEINKNEAPEFAQAVVESRLTDTVHQANEVLGSMEQGLQHGLHEISGAATQVLTVGGNMAEELKDTAKLSLSSFQEHVGNVAGSLVTDGTSSIKDGVEGAAEDVKERITILGQEAEDSISLPHFDTFAPADPVPSGVAASQTDFKEGRDLVSNINDEFTKSVLNITEEITTDAADAKGTVTSFVHDMADKDHDTISGVKTSNESMMKEVKDGAASAASTFREETSKAFANSADKFNSQNVKETLNSTVDAVEEANANLLDSQSKKVHDLASAMGNISNKKIDVQKEMESIESTVDTMLSESSKLEIPGSLARCIHEKADTAVLSAVERTQKEEKELYEAFSSSAHAAEESTQFQINEEEKEAVLALELAEISVQKALNQAEMTIVSETQRAQSTFLAGAESEMGVVNSAEKDVTAAEDHTENNRSNNKNADGELLIAINVEDNTVESLMEADESVKIALSRAEETISAEALKSLSLLTETDGSKLVVAGGNEIKQEPGPNDEHHGKNGTGKSILYNVADSTVATLEQAEESIKLALDRAEQTISAEALRSPVSVQKSEIDENVTSLPEDKQSTTNEILNHESGLLTEQDQMVATLEHLDESVKMALSRAEGTISAEATRALSSVQIDENIKEISTGTESHFHTSIAKTEEHIEKAVTKASLVHQFSEGIHDRVRREVSTLMELPGTSPREGETRRGRSTSDITNRKAPIKSDSWESNLRKGTVASSGKITRNTTTGDTGSKKPQSLIPRSTRKVGTVLSQNESSSQKTFASSARDAKKRPPLRKAKSLAEDSSEEAKKRIKKMPSQGSTRKTAISVESAVDAAGETVVKRALDKAKSMQDSAEETSSETSKSTLTTSSSTQQQRETHSSSSEGVRESASAVQTELVQAAATIQDAFRDITQREHNVAVDEDGKQVAAQRSAVLEEIAEEVGVERQGASRRGSRQESQDTSTSESSLSSAATRIQAGYRGYLARRHRLHRHSTAGTASLGTASSSVSMSMSRDSDVGVVRAMSLLEDSEVQRHQIDPLDLLPEANGLEYGPAKYVADVHRARGVERGAEWARSLDSGLSSGPERHTPVRSAVSVQQRALRGRDLDEHVWRTLEQEMLAGEAATDDSEGGGGEGPRRMSTRRGLHRGNAMQLPTTSSSTPPSLEEPPSARHTGEFHDLLVLPLHGAAEAAGAEGPQPSAPPLPPQQLQSSRAGFSLNGSSPTLDGGGAAEDAVAASPPTAAQHAQQEARQAPGAPGVATAPPPPLAHGDSDAPDDAASLPDMKTADAAATKIQAGFRGYKVRRELREQRQDQNASGASGASESDGGTSLGPSEPAKPAKPAQPVQQQCRSSSCGGGHPRDMEAALGLDEELLQRSAARIQAGVRGFLVRRRQHNAAVAAAKIQAGFRGYRARRDLKQRMRSSAAPRQAAQQAQ